MRLTLKIRKIAEDMGLAFVHGTTEQLGVLVDTVGSPMMALLDYVSSTESFHGCERVETASLNVFFLERVSPSFSPDEVVAVQDRCKALADRFVDRAWGNDSPEFSDLGIDGSVSYQRVNLRYKGVYGGVMVSLRVADYGGFAAPSSQYAPVSVEEDGDGDNT